MNNALSARFRTPAIVAASLFGVLVVSHLLPTGIANQTGVPASILFSGLVDGLIIALFAVGIVLVYRSLRVINFAQTFLGGAGAVMTFELVQLTPVPFPLAVLIGLAVGTAIGVFFDLVFGRRFFRAPRLVLTFFTIIAGEFLSSQAVGIVTTSGIFPPVAQRSLGTELGGGDHLRQALPFPGFKFHVGSGGLPFGFSHVFIIVASVITLVAIFLFLSRTRLGVAVRAMAENQDRAATLGISVGMLSTVVWGLSGLVSTVGALGTGMLLSPQGAATFVPETLGAALAAAVLARMESFGVAIAAAIGLTVLTESLRYALPEQGFLVDLLQFGVLSIGLLFQGRRQGGRSERGDESFSATDEVRPVPRELNGLTQVRVAKYSIIAVMLGAAVVFPFVSNSGDVDLAALVLLLAIVGLSIVVLTGWAGQASLGQFGLVGIGALVGGTLNTRTGIPFWVAVPLATIVVGVLAGILSIPALRIRGLFLLVSTFAFAEVVQNLVFSPRYFGWLQPGSITRPTLLLIDFDNERSMYFLCLFAFGLAVVIVSNLRRTRFGRLVIATRENESNSQSAGIAATRTKVLAFVVSGMLAGFAGAIYGFLERGVNPGAFTAFASFNILQQVIVGGASSIGGALLGVSVFQLSDRVIPGIPVFGVLFGPIFLPLLSLVVLFVSPGGMISMLVKIRDAMLRIIAQRNQIIVPSLFADIDPDALRQRLVPLASITAAGTAAARGASGIRSSRLFRRGDLRHRKASGGSPLLGKAYAEGDVEATPAAEGSQA